MRCRELAGRLGLKLTTFYKTRGRLHLIDRMPRPLSEAGRPQWDRATIEAWLGRHHPHTLKPRPANDTAPPPADDAQWRQYLQDQYGSPHA